MTGTFTLPGGGALAATGRRQATASCATEINDLVLGSGLLGPQPMAYSGGGALSGTGGRLVWSFTLTGGGQLAATGLAGGHAIITGGGAITFTGGRVVLTGYHLTPAVLEIQAFPLGLGAVVAAAAPDLLASVASNTLAASPATLQAAVTNGTPGGGVAFAIHYGPTTHAVLSTTFDDAGAVLSIPIPVDVDVPGSYTLTATDMTTGNVATVPFTVASITTPSSIGVIVTAPPANVQPNVGVRKWVFQDPASGEVYHFHVNPSSMNSPFAPKRFTFQATTAIDGNRLAFEGQASPTEWQFEGTLFEKAQYDAFVHWLGKRNRIWLTDHWGRAWLVYLTSFQPVPKRSHEFVWLHSWTMTALIFEGPVTPV